MKHGASESCQAQCSHLPSVFPSVRLTRGEHFRRGTQHWASLLTQELNRQVTYTPFFDVPEMATELKGRNARVQAVAESASGSIMMTVC